MPPMLVARGLNTHFGWYYLTEVTNYERSGIS